MKKLFVFGSFIASIILNSCNNNTGTDSAGDRNSPDHTEQHSGEEITPQAELDSDSNRLEIDTVSSAESVNDRKDSI